MRAAHASSAACLVLVVDDVEDNRDLYTEILFEEGYDVVCANDGADAVEAVTVHRPVIVIMDLGMPVLDGYEATRRIRSLAEIAQPYIIALSAFTDRTSRERAMRAGCNEFFSKPFIPGELARHLNAVRATRTS